MNSNRKFTKNKVGLFFMIFALTLFVFSFFISFSSVSSPAYASIYNIETTRADDLSHAKWILDNEEQQVEFYHCLINCGGKAVVFLKFNNKNDHPVNISWKGVLTVSEGIAKENTFSKKELLIPPGITTPADCTEAVNKLMILLPSNVATVAMQQWVDYSFKEVRVKIEP